MKPGDTIQFSCSECQAVFTLTVDGVKKADQAGELDFGLPIYCPFCGHEYPRPQHDLPLIAGN
jgi:hypothetical protein